MTPAIRLRHVTHRWGAFQAVGDLSLDVGHGEIFGFIGPNGAGKTTTIRIMATLLEPTEGQVEIDGIDAVVDPVAVRRIIGYMPDHSGVYERITVREYLEFFAAAASVPGRATVDAAVELTGLGAFQERLVANLSKGMRQRLGLARVLLHDPKVLILDEPASDLDPRARIEMRDLLRELRDLGKTIFLSSHILSELDDICTSVGIIEKGRLLVAGPIDAISHAARPRTPVPEAGPGAPGSGHLPVAHAGGAEPPLARLRIRIVGESADVLPALRAAPGVVRASAGASGWLTVEHRGDDRFVAGLVKELVLSGALVVGIEPERAELERIFMQVTREKGT